MKPSKALAPLLNMWGLKKPDGLTPTLGINVTDGWLGPTPMRLYPGPLDRKHRLGALGREVYSKRVRVEGQKGVVAHQIGEVGRVPGHFQ